MRLPCDRILGDVAQAVNDSITPGVIIDKSHLETALPGALPSDIRMSEVASLGYFSMPNLLKTPLKRSEEHTSELQSLMRISYAVFCLKKKKDLKAYQSLTALNNIT